LRNRFRARRLGILRPTGTAFERPFALSHDFSLHSLRENLFALATAGNFCLPALRFQKYTAEILIFGKNFFPLQPSVKTQYCAFNFFNNIHLKLWAT